MCRRCVIGRREWELIGSDGRPPWVGPIELWRDNGRPPGGGRSISPGCFANLMGRGPQRIGQKAYE